MTLFFSNLPHNFHVFDTEINFILSSDSKIITDMANIYVCQCNEEKIAAEIRKHKDFNITIFEVDDDKKEQVNHPSHYGGKKNPYEAIKVIEAWKLNFNLGNTVKYISRAGKKNDLIEDLEKALWYLNRELDNLKKK